MSKELTFKSHDFDIVSGTNCLGSSLTTITGLLSARPLHPERIAEVLPMTNDVYLTNLFDLFRKHNINIADHQIISVNYRKRKVFNAFVDSLEGGALCEVSVDSTPWIENVLREKEENKLSMHSIIIYGYYSPETAETGWLYIADSYSGRKLFVGFDLLFPMFSRIESEYIYINLFGYCFDQSPLLEKGSIKDCFLDHRSKKEIFERLPKKKTKRAQLKTLLTHP